MAGRKVRPHRLCHDGFGLSPHRLSPLFGREAPAFRHGDERPKSGDIRPAGQAWGNVSRGGETHRRGQLRDLIVVRPEHPCQDRRLDELPVRRTTA